MRVEITNEPIDEVAARRLVGAPDCGAVLVFWGVVRNHHAGKAVSHIDYHCYREMAERELRAVAEEAVEAHGLDREQLAVIHRVGDVAVGEASLLVAVASPHRGPAFEGVLSFIDTLKKRVPIWKKEYGPDGSHWVEGVLPEQS